MSKKFLKILTLCVFVSLTSQLSASRDNVDEFNRNDIASDNSRLVRNRIITFEDSRSERFIKRASGVLGGVLGAIGGDYIGRSLMSLRALLDEEPNSSYTSHTYDMNDEAINRRFSVVITGAIVTGWLYSPSVALCLVAIGVGDYLVNTNFLSTVAKWALDPAISGPRVVLATGGSIIGTLAGLKVGEKIVEVKRKLLRETSAAKRAIEIHGIKCDILEVEAGEHLKELNRRLKRRPNNNEMKCYLAEQMRISSKEAEQVLANMCVFEEQEIK